MNGQNVGQQGWGQSTAAMQGLMRQGLGGAQRATGGTRRKRRASASPSRKRKRSASSSKRRASGRATLKAGSPAAKAWGRKMRALRKRRG